MRHLLKMLPLILGFFTVVLLVYHFGNTELLVVVLCFTIMLPIIYLVVDRFIQKNNLLKMKEEALRAELALLKNQINPHFFFNTLNNLYGLAVAKSDQAPTVILKLSDLMRFTIYEGKKDHVFLRDEIAYLKNYLDIHRIRTKMENLDLSFETNVDDELVQVPPLMFIMLVENAIKHGAGSKTEGAFIHIKLEAQADQVSFHIENNFEILASKGKSGGIGLTNLKRRLALLFPEQHQLEIQSSGDIYRVHLRLQL